MVRQKGLDSDHSSRSIVRRAGSLALNTYHETMGQRGKDFRLV